MRDALIAARAAVPRRRWATWWQGSMVALLLGVLGLASWEASRARSDARKPLALDDIAERYVSLALALDRVRPGEVDTYFGPDMLKDASRLTGRAPAGLLAQARALRSALGRARSQDAEREARLAGFVDGLVGRLQVTASGTRPSLRHEAARSYGLTVGAPSSTEILAARAAIDAALPGAGSLGERVRAHRARLLVRRERRIDVFTRAVAACRAATVDHWRLPANESVDVTWASSGAAAWHQFKGRGTSRLAVNPDGVALLDAAVDVACHETYPGHHAQFVLHETAAGGALPLEEQIALLRSPTTVLREGAAQYGVDLAFTPAARLALERDTLAPMAGIAAADVERQHALRPHLRMLERLVPSVLVAWDEGRIDDAEATRQLTEEALVADAASLLAFAREYGAYVIAYTAARDRVQAIVTADSDGTREGAWRALRALVAPPHPERLAGQ